MKPFRSLFFAAALCLVALVACSSSSSSDSSASSCAQAKQVSDDCNKNAKPADGGGSITITFDQAKCEQAGDQGKKVADCIVANKSNCDCTAKCSLTGAC